MIMFNDENIFVGQIKQLLSSFNLPQCRVYKEADKDNYKPGDFYIKDGALYSVRYKFKKDGSGNYVRNSFGVPIKDGIETVYISNYTFGEKYINLTRTLDLHNNIYDSYTHAYLGNYLRFLRDFKGVDLMSLYNCCGYEVANNLNLTIFKRKNYTEDSFTNNCWNVNTDVKVSESIVDVTDSSSITIENKNIVITPTPLDLYTEVTYESTSNLYDILVIPVKFGQKYTIALDWTGQVEMFCGFYENGYIKSPLFAESGLGSIETETFYTHNTNRFNKPFVYSKLVNLSTVDYQQEENLKLFIILPKKCSSSIVVLEGDYTKDTELVLKQRGQSFATERIAKDTPIENLKFNTKHQLLNINTGRKFLLADRLVEYLTHQAIAKDDPVVNNIKRTQLKLYDMNQLEKPYKYFGIWDDKMKIRLYEFALKKNLPTKYSDLLYYLDKDLEKEIGGLPINVGTIYWEGTDYEIK